MQIIEIIRKKKYCIVANERKVINCLMNDYDIRIIIIRNNVLGNFIQNIFVGNKNLTNFATLKQMHLTSRNR